MDIKIRHLFNSFLAIIFFCSFGINLFAQKDLNAKKTNTPPVIDGIILNEEWEVNDSAIHFIQIEPDKDAPATEPTVVFFMYDDKNLYFAFKCYDRDPEEIVANVLTRDRVDPSEDAVVILLDTYFDRRSAFAFAINSMGTQTDFKVGDDGRSKDINWDEQWFSAGSITSWGRGAEIAIPFPSLA